MPTPILPPPETDIRAPFFEESFKNRYFNRLEVQKMVNLIVIGVFDDAEAKKHNENIVENQEHTGIDEERCPESGAHEKH